MSNDAIMINIEENITNATLISQSDKEECNRGQGSQDCLNSIDVRFLTIIKYWNKSICQ